MLGFGKKDDVVLVSTDEFLEQLVRQLDGKPFVALNVSKALTDDVETTGGYITVAAIAFEREFLAAIPKIMGTLTGNHKVSLRGSREMLEILQKNNMSSDETDDSNPQDPQDPPVVSKVVEF